MSARIVIIGGGLTAATAAEELRSRGHDGPIDLVAAEPHRPYQRPPLSKGYLAGGEDLDAVYVHSEPWEQEHDVTLHLGNPAIRIADRVVELADGTRLNFDQLLIATGATPRALPVPGADATGVHTFRTLDDADQLREALSAGDKRVVFIGSGWIGLELAAAARGFGNEVTVVAPEKVPLSAALGDEMGAMFQSLHEDHGVVFRLQEGVESIAVDEHGAVSGVTTSQGDIPADIVIVGIGAVPDTALAETAGLEVERGILVNERMETSVSGILAAGDVANAYHPVLGQRLRSEHWANAIASGKVAASTMLGGDTVLDDIPYFYTDQFDLGMEYSGYGPLTRGAEVVVRGDAGTRELIAFWVADDHVIAGMNVNIWDVNEEIQRLIRDRVTVDRARLADPSVDLASIT